MSLMNRLGNARNPYQTNAKRVLCVCSAGLLRSPTAANVLHREFGFNTRSAGYSQEYALIPVDEVLLAWADEIVCVEPSVEKGVMNFVTNHTKLDPDFIRENITTLNIPDQYPWGAVELQEAILQQYQEKSKA